MSADARQLFEDVRKLHSPDTPTPRTDALDRELFMVDPPEGSCAYDEIEKHACKLEAELASERAKVRALRDACESICGEWGENHDANPIGAGGRMYAHASKALEKQEHST